MRINSKLFSLLLITFALPLFGVFLVACDPSAHSIDSKITYLKLNSTILLPASNAILPWPPLPEQASISVLGIGKIGDFNDSAPIPIASVAKIMTALVVLKDHPLKLGSQGPLLTMTAQDADYFGTYLDRGGSVAKVVAGEQLSEYQLLQALLVPSADNIALTLAMWDAGSLNNFLAKMNALAKELGATHTTYTDPSGYDPGTISTASDQVLIGEKAMSDPSVAQIVATNHLEFPVAGWLPNYNPLVGYQGVNGVKSGYTEQAGGCLVFSATRNVGTTPVTVVGAVLGYKGGGALHAVGMQTLALLNAVYSSLQVVPVTPPSGHVAKIEAPWGQSAYASADPSQLTTVAYPGETLSYSFQANALNVGTLAKGIRVGTLTASNSMGVVATFPVTLDSELTQPDIQ